MAITAAAANVFRRKQMHSSKRICSLVLLVCGASTAMVALPAPTRWESAAGGNGHFYEAVRVGSAVSWDSARAAARARGPGWDLATITSSEENAFVKSLFATRPEFVREFRRCPDPDICWYRIGPWIGGFNVTDLRQFQWVSGEPVSFTDWGVKTIGPQGQQVAYLSRYFSSTFGWSTPNAGLYPIAYVAELTRDWASLVLKQSTVAGCKTVTGTVVISQPAPPEGLVVNLSTTLHAARSPPTLTILPGENSGTFTIRTTPVPASETGTVRATLRGTTLSQLLTVRPIGMQYLTLSAAKVVGGNSLTGKATLECKATAAPIIVELTSSHPAVASPVAVSIVVPQGMQFETFDIATRAVLDQRSVTITGKANGIRKSKTLKVTAPAVASPTSVKFGDVIVGSTSPARNVTLYNRGAVSFSITGIGLTGSEPQYFAQRSACPAQLAAGASCTIGVTYSPRVLGTRGATLRIATTATSASLSVWVSGTGVAAP